MPITNTVIMTWTSMIVLFILLLILARHVKMIPGKKQNIIELVFESLLDFLDSITGNVETSMMLFPLVATIILFILAANWVEVLPGLGSIGLNKTVGAVTTFTPFMRSPSSDLNFTLALACVSVFSIQFFGIQRLGFLKRALKYFSFKGVINFFVGILELISDFSKLISFSFRLFGSIFAGEVLLAVMGLLMPFLAPAPFLLLELFIGLLQAIVFGCLTAIFMNLAGEEEEEEIEKMDAEDKKEEEAEYANKKKIAFGNSI